MNYDAKRVEAILRRIEAAVQDEYQADVTIACCMVITSLVHSLPAKRQHLGWSYVEGIMASLKQTQTQKGTHDE